MGKYTAAVHDRLVLPARALVTRGQEQVLQLTGQSVPARVAVRLLIDTGSGRSTLTPSVLAQLAAPVAAPVKLATGIGSRATSLCWVRLEFPGTTLGAIPELAVARLEMPPSLGSLQGLIGRDVLSRWESLLYQGRRSRLTIRDTAGGLLGWLWGRV
jgi:hypothetical protein